MIHVVDEHNNLVQRARTSDKDNAESGHRWSYYTAFMADHKDGTLSLITRAKKYIDNIKFANIHTFIAGAYYKIDDSKIARYMGHDTEKVWFCREEDLGISFWDNIDVNDGDHNNIAERVCPNILVPKLDLIIEFYVKMEPLIMSPAAFRLIGPKVADTTVKFAGEYQWPDARIPAIYLVDDFGAVPSDCKYWKKESRTIILDPALRPLLDKFMVFIAPGRRQYVTLVYENLFNFLLIMDRFGYLHMRELVDSIARSTPIFYAQSEIPNIIEWALAYESGFWGLADIMKKRLVNCATSVGAEAAANESHVNVTEEADAPPAETKK
jgi:hypothetical protein